MIATLAVLVILFGVDRESPETTSSTATSDSASPSIPLKSGIDLIGMDTSVRPQDDFFAYANGQWLDTTEIPADKSSWGSFNILHEKSLNQLKVIIEESSVSLGESSSTDNVEDHASAETETEKNEAATAKIGAFYRAWLNEEELERRQLSPIARELDFVTQAQSHQDIITLFAAYNAIGVDSPLNFWVGQDDKDSTRYTVFLTQSGLGLPDRDYYFDDSERGREILSKYQNFIVEILRLADLPEPEQSAREIIALETRLAEHHWTKVDNRDSEKTYNPHSREQMQALLSQYNFDAFASGVGVGDETQYIVRQPSYLEALNTLIADIDLKSWQNYLRFNILVSYAPYLNKPFEQAHFDFYNKTLSGQPQQQARWKLAISSINSNMGELLGQLYVAKHFPPQAKARMLELVDNLIAAYRTSISELEWMSPETRQKALAKLSLFTPKIGYPDKWKDYSSLVIAEDDLVGNIKRARSFNHYLQTDKLGKPVDRSEWFMAPQRVNAYYNPGMNEIVFPAAILQAPFFDLEADDAVNYGGIGGVIGHEIGHGFDDQGSKYTGEGNLESWWTEQDRTSFEQRTGQLVEQYAAYEALPDLFINGELTLGENIGDLGGLSIALNAYQLSNKGKPAPELDGFSGEQRVLLGWAQAWRVKRRDELAERLIKTDPHSPPKYRVNGVLPNIDAYYPAFDVKAGDLLYLPPEQRVKIW
jgi:predicted metalloendopeptidase